MSSFYKMLSFNIHYIIVLYEYTMTIGTHIPMSNAWQWSVLLPAKWKKVIIWFHIVMKFGTNLEAQQPINMKFNCGFCKVVGFPRLPLYLSTDVGIRYPCVTQLTIYTTEDTASSRLRTVEHHDYYSLSFHRY